LCRKLVTVVSQMLTSKPMSLSRGPPPNRPTQEGVSPARVGSIGAARKSYGPLQYSRGSAPRSPLCWPPLAAGLGRWTLDKQGAR
jgi:hypothetical protein